MRRRRVYPDGMPMGFKEDGTPVTWDGPESNIITGGPGSSKTSSVLICELLNIERAIRSYYIYDPSLEVGAVCAKYLRKIYGKKHVRIINSQKVLLNVRPDLVSDGWNPIKLDHKSPTFVEDCAAIGVGAITVEAHEHQKFFGESARSAIAGLVMRIVNLAAYITENNLKEGKPPVQPSFAEVVRILCQPHDKRKEDIEKLMRPVLVNGQVFEDFDVNIRLAKFLNTSDATKDVGSTIETQEDWVTPLMREDFELGGVDLGMLSRVPCVIFFCQPVENLKRNYQRLGLTAVLRSLYRQPAKVPTTIYIDDAYLLNRHDDFLSALSALRKFKGRIVSVWQNLGQITELYSDAASLFFNGAHLAFNPREAEGAKFLSARCGEEVIARASFQGPSKPGDIWMGGGNWHTEIRPRFRVGQMYAMPAQMALAIKPNVEIPDIVDMLRYYEIPELAARADENPYYPKRSFTNWLRRLAEE